MRRREFLSLLLLSLVPWQRSVAGVNDSGKPLIVIDGWILRSDDLDGGHRSQ